MLTLTVVTATLSFNVFPPTLAIAMLNVNVLPLKVDTVLMVANAKLSVYVLSLTVLTATLSFNMLPRYLRLQIQCLVLTCCN